MKLAIGLNVAIWVAIASVATTHTAARSPGCEPTTDTVEQVGQAGPFDLAATDNGGRVEWASSQRFPGFVAANLNISSARRRNFHSEI